MNECKLILLIPTVVWIKLKQNCILNLTLYIGKYGSNKPILMLPETHKTQSDKL